MPDLLKVLLVDDDWVWAEHLKRELESRGFSCKVAGTPAEAEKLLFDDWSFRHVVLDVLFEAPRGKGKAMVTADMQGDDLPGKVVSRGRSDVRFVMVTSAPEKKNEGDLHGYRSDMAALKKLPGVVGVIDKFYFNTREMAEDGLRELVEMLRGQGQTSQYSPEIRLHLGLAVLKATFQVTGDGLPAPLTLADLAAHRQRKGWLTPQDSPRDWIHLLLTGDSGVPLHERFIRERHLLKQLGDQPPVSCHKLREGSPEWRILFHLAREREFAAMDGRDDRPIIIRNDDYEYDPRQPSPLLPPSGAGLSRQPMQTRLPDRSASPLLSPPGAGLAPREQEAVMQDAIHGDAEDDLGAGMQPIGRNRPSNPLKQNISRLKRILAPLLGRETDRILVFNNEHQGYQLDFDLRLSLYPI